MVSSLIKADWRRRRYSFPENRRLLLVIYFRDSQVATAENRTQEKRITECYPSTNVPGFGSRDHCRARGLREPNACSAAETFPHSRSL